MNKKSYLTNRIIIGVIIIIISIFIPFFDFCIGWLIGQLIRIIFGITFIKGLTFLHINITQSQIPLFCGTLGVISAFFKDTIKLNQKDN